MSYTLIIEPHAERQLSKLPPAIRIQMYPRLLALEDEPRPIGVRKLRGYADGWRIRVGDYRALYLIDDRAAMVTVFDIDLRDKVYKKRR